MSDSQHVEIVNVLTELGSSLDCSEVHGLLCGLLCVLPTDRAKTRWFREMLLGAELGVEQVSAHGNSLRALDSLFGTTVSSLNAADLTFEPLLPAEEAPFSDRAVGLASWCQGFCYGFGLVVAAERSLSDDTREILRDFSAIARTADKIEHTGDVDEASLMQLTEFVRVGTLLLNEEMQPPGPSRGESRPRQLH